MGNKKQIEVESLWLDWNGERIEYVPKKEKTEVLLGCVHDDAKTMFTKNCPVKVEVNKLYGIMVDHHYRHFKGDRYLVTGVSKNATTGEHMVHYVAYGYFGKITGKYCRPISDFFADISDLYSDDVNTTKQIYRFELDDSTVTADVYKKYIKWYPAKEELTHETL